MNAPRWLLAALSLLALGGCGTLADVGAWGDRTLLQPMGQVFRAVGLDTTPAAADTCTRSTPAPGAVARAPGLGGTGAPGATPDPGGMGGTGQVALQPPGIGGTGQVAQRPGLGGTGQVADNGLGGTGIVGVVTGFGSVCVNGLKVEYEADTPVQQDGRPVPQSALAVGQVVALQADGPGGQLQAQRIVVLDAAVGPLGAVDAASGRFSVMGQAATALDPSVLRGLQPGQWVRVSGQRLADGEIRATRVQPAEPGAAWVAGPLVRTADGTWQVGATPLAADTALPADAAPGLEVAVAGDWIDGRLRASRVTVRPTRAALGPVQSVVLQGYVHQVSGQQLTLGFETLTLSRVMQVIGGTLEALRSGQPVLVRGRLDDQQRLIVEQLEIRREGRGGSRSSSEAGDDRAGSDSSGSSGQGRGRGGDSDGQGRGRGRGRSGGD